MTVTGAVNVSARVRVRGYGSRVLRIRVLGELVVEGDDGPVEIGGSWQARSLLAWLALHPGTHLRGDVAPRFWPDVLDSSARASLRNALWAIRKALGEDADLLVTTRERVGLESPPDVWVDSLAFDEYVEAGELEEALALSRGDALAGIEDDWAYEFRDEHALRLSRLLEALATQAEDTDAEAAIEWSRKRAALDPLDEGAQRALIARMIAAGDRSGALATYGRFRQRLRTELGISPSSETRDLVLELRAGDDLDGGPEGPGDAPATPGDGGAWSPGALFPLPPRLRGVQTPLIGRGHEIASLRKTWRGVNEGGGARLVRLTGEAGIGKSRLARELAIGAGSEGAVVLFGMAGEDRLVTHQLWAEAIDHLAGELGAAEVQRRTGGRSRDLVPVAPRLARELGEAEADAAKGSQSRLYRLFEGVSCLLESVAEDVPVLLIADDVHWADESTLALLRHLLESRRTSALMVVATQRTEIEPSDALAETMLRLSREGLAHEVALRGLDDHDVAELSQGLSRHELTDELLSAIARETSGNPFFVGELVRHLDDSDEGTGVLSLTQAEVPERIRDVINLRLTRLSEPAARLLGVAAVIGGEFDLTLLEEVGTAEGHEALALLEECLAARLITELDYEDHDAFAFTHVLIRRTLLSRLPRASRRRIHARVAEALEAEHGESALIEIAYHLCEARTATDRDRALDYATRAAQHAIDNLAYADAVDLFTRARALLPEGDERRRALALKRAVAYQALFHAVYDAAAGGARAAPSDGPG